MRIQKINFNIFNSINKHTNKYAQRAFLKNKYDVFVFTGRGIRYAPNEVEEQKIKIKSVLQESLMQNKTLKTPEIAAITGIALHTVRKRISQDDSLKQLWMKVRHIDYSKYSDEEKADFEIAIKELLERLNATNTKMSVNEIVQKLGVSKTIIFGIINKNEYYKQLYENVHKTRPQKATLQEVELQEEQIKELLLEVMNTGIKKSEREYSMILGITEKIFRLRIKNNPELKVLYEQVKNPPRIPLDKEIEVKKALIKIILKQYIDDGKKISRDEISEKVGISGGTFRKIVISDEEMKLLWAQAQKKPRTLYTHKEIEKMDDYIQWFLDDKIKKEQKATVKEIAQFLDITGGLTGKRLNENPKLKYRWNKVKSQNMVHYDKGEKGVQTEQITELLKEANANGTRLTYEEIAKITKLSVSVIKSRIKGNRKAQKLWNENKEL